MVIATVPNGLVKEFLKLFAEANMLWIKFDGDGGKSGGGGQV